MSQPAPVPAQPRWDARLYADNTGHHRRHDDDFLRGVAFRRGARVLDIGCGVGDLTARLAQLVRDGDVLGVDADPDMVATARARAGSPVLRFAVGRAQELHRVVPAASVDIAVSVACLHWVPAADHPGVLAQVRRVLRGRGVLRAEFGGSGQIAAVRALLADAGFDVGPAAAGWVRLLRQRRRIPDESAFVGWLRSQVLAAYDPVLPAERVRDFRRVAEDRALAELRRADGSYDQDYVRLDLLARSR